MTEEPTLQEVYEFRIEGVLNEDKPTKNILSQPAL